MGWWRMMTGKSSTPTTRLSGSYSSREASLSSTGHRGLKGGPMHRSLPAATRSSSSATWRKFTLLYYWANADENPCRLEVYFKDSRSLLVVFLDKKKRSETERRFTNIIEKNNADPALTSTLPRTPLFSRMGSRVLSNFRSDELSSATRRWQAREISNVRLPVDLFPAFD